jgi:multisubunit Na+/H+ antiporter MnhB subunit
MENLSLIDWPMVAFAALWILGLAVILSALGFATYEAAEAGERLREHWKLPGYQFALNGGLVLFCLGLSGSTGAGWERVLWVLLALAFAVYAWQSRRRARGG